MIEHVIKQTYILLKEAPVLFSFLDIENQIPEQKANSNNKYTRP